MNPKICPICRNSTPSLMTGNGNDGTYNVDCWQCGKYVISGSAVNDAESIPLPTDKRALASAWLVHNRPSRFDDQHLAFVRGNIRRPSMLHRAMSMLRWFSHQFPEGQQFSTNQFEHPVVSGANPMLPYSWSRDLLEAVFVFNRMLLDELQYLSRGHDGTSLITPKGWIALEGQPSTESTMGFVAMWFDESMRQFHDLVVDPAIRESGYEPLRIDNKEHTNKIDDEIVASIRASRFVVADYTGGRGGVYYEAGFAHGLGLPVFFMARDGEQLHFDVRQYNTIFWKADDFTDARERLANRILATLGRGPLKST